VVWALAEVRNPVRKRGRAVPAKRRRFIAIAYGSEEKNRDSSAIQVMKNETGRGFSMFASVGQVRF
jgi:hypothetical protein